MFIGVEIDFTDHPKTVRLCVALGSETAWAHLVNLWGWVMKYAKDGDLARFTPVEIEHAARWRGEPGAFYKAAVWAGFLDESPLRIHDWMEHNGKWVEKASRDKKRLADKRLKARDEADLAPVATRKPPKSRAVPGVARPSRDVAATSQRRSSDVAGTSPLLSLPLLSKPEEAPPPVPPVRAIQVLDATAPEPAPPPKPNAHVTAWAQWLEAFREVRRCEYVTTKAGGDKSQLGTVLRQLKPDEVAQLPAMYRAYLRSPDPFVAKQGYSLTYFCSRVNEFRGPAPPQSDQRCAWHQTRHSHGRPSHHPLSSCPECKHLAASARARVSEPTPLAIVLPTPDPAKLEASWRAGWTQERPDEPWPGLREAQELLMAGGRS